MGYGVGTDFASYDTQCEVTNSIRDTPYSLLLTLPVLFTGIAFVQLSLVQTGRLTPGRFIPVVVLTLCLGGAGWVLSRWRPNHDRLLLPLVGMLSGLGFAEVARLAPDLSVAGLRGSLLILPRFLSGR